jgi:hypothetical protein
LAQRFKIGCRGDVDGWQLLLLRPKQSSHVLSYIIDAPSELLTRWLELYKPLGTRVLTVELISKDLCRGNRYAPT